MSQHDNLTITFLKNTIITGEENRFDQTMQPTIEGAKAALETFYHAFNNRSLDLFSTIWVNDSYTQLNNPLGGIIRGIKPISKLYTHIFEGNVHVKVALYDIVAYASSTIVIFAGQERGSYQKDKKSYPLVIRTTRIFAYVPKQGGWRQIHHHGSIDDIALLAHYKKAVMGGQKKNK